MPQVALLNGMLLLNDGKTNDAFDTLQKSAKANPDNLQVKICWAAPRWRRATSTAAQQSFRDAVRINPRNADAQQGLAQISINRNATSRTLSPAR